MSRLDDAQDLVDGDVVQALQRTVGPVDLDIRLSRRAQAEVESGVVAGEIAAAGLALADLALVVGGDGDAGAMPLL